MTPDIAETAIERKSVEINQRLASTILPNLIANCFEGEEMVSLEKVLKSAAAA
jgi:hypothetical protein